MPRTKPTTSSRRKAGEVSADREGSSDTSTAGRRFTPALKTITEGGSVYGNLVAYERGRLGWSQKQLAAKIHTSPATIGRIEQGHPPGADLHRALTKTLGIESQSGLGHRLASASAVPVHRATEAARGIGERTPRLRRPSPRLRRPSLYSRSLWGVVAIALVGLAWLVGGQLSTEDSSSFAAQPSVQASSVLAAPAIGRERLHARIEARIAALAKAKRAAQKARERERAAAAAAAAARKAKAEANATKQASSTDTQSVSPPVISSPSPSPAPSTGSSGGGGSSGPAPSLGHGIGSG
jgi:transcriptional regulator with XRE-family HTH domain